MPHTNVRTFDIRQAHAADDERDLAAFLRSVEVVRIDTAHSGATWHLLVLYKDLKSREESEQIRTAITASLRSWRARVASAQGRAATDILPDVALASIARLAPTTEHELASLGPLPGLEDARMDSAIVQVVRETLDDLTGND